jgi:hypothetical protein
VSLLIFGLVVAFGAAYAVPAAQAPAKKALTPLTVDDYTKWRTISSQDISGDGKWVAYGVSITNVPTTETKPVLHLLNLDTNQDVTVTDGTGPAFSSDSKWIGYIVDPGQGRGGRAGRAGGGGATNTATTTRQRRDSNRRPCRRHPRVKRRLGAVPPRRRQRSHAVRSCGISPPARCVRGRTFSPSRSRPTPRN